MGKVDQNIDAIHEELFELLMAFDLLCGECGVNYSLHGGTLIGAIRYDDFIPWDDDADVTVMSEDYIKLKQYVENKENCEFRFADEDGLGHRFTRKKLDGRVMGWIDVIEYNYVSDNNFARKFRNLILIMLAAMSKSSEQVKTATVKKHGYLQIVIFRILYYLGFLFGKENILNAHRYVSRHWFLGQKRIMQRTNDQVRALRRLVKREWYSKYERHRMHGYDFMITSNYHEVLAQVYGENWLTPPPSNEQVSHENVVRAAYQNLQNKYEDKK